MLSLWLSFERESFALYISLRVMSVFAEAINLDINLDIRKFTGLRHHILTEWHWLDLLPPIALFT